MTPFDENQEEDRVREPTPTIFDELRGAVLDLPHGTILPGWVEKSAVIAMLDRIESEHEPVTYTYDESCPMCRAGGHVVPPPHRMKL